MLICKCDVNSAYGFDIKSLIILQMLRPSAPSCCELPQEEVWTQQSGLYCGLCLAEFMLFSSNLAMMFKCFKLAFVQLRPKKKIKQTTGFVVYLVANLSPLLQLFTMKLKSFDVRHWSFMTHCTSLICSFILLNEFDFSYLFLSLLFKIFFLLKWFDGFFLSRYITFIIMMWCLVMINVYKFVDKLK